MSSWFAVEKPTVSEDKKTAVFRVQNSTLEPLRAQAAAAAVEMAGAPFEEPHFAVEPSLFGLEPGEARDVTIALTEKAPPGKELPVRLRVEKADLPDHFVFGPGVTLGKKDPPKPWWLYFTIGAAVIVVGVIIAIVAQSCGKECKTNAECRNGFVCSKDGECLCGGAASCPTTTPQCFNATCRPVCSKATKDTCPHGERCDEAAKVCVPGCDAASDCDDGFTCKNGSCLCGDKPTCPTNTRCYSGQCEKTCKFGAGCPANMVCNDVKVCVPRCDSNADCASKRFRCDLTTHTCKPFLSPMEGTIHVIEEPAPLRDLELNR